MNDKTQLATFRVEPKLWEAFKAQARKNGKTASDVLTDFVQRYAMAGEAITPVEINFSQLDNIELCIDEKIAPIKAELAELRAQMGEFAA